MQEHRLALKPGYQLDHFRIEAVLGKGGFGITYLALDLRLGKRVAIKELLPDSIATRVEGYTVVPQSGAQDESWQWARQRFLEEARVLAGFSHPAIVGVHLLLEAHGTVYMVMDYVEGESYESRLKRIGKEPDQNSLMSVMGPVLDGLAEVHAKGLLHRDIKPENILINARGNPVLIDFGSARESVGKTMTMTSIVTHGYSPIEQYQTKGRMGPWTDIYAMGAVMCRAMTGEKPPVAADRLMDDDYAWLSYRQDLPSFGANFKQAVDWALRVRPEDRPQSVLKFVAHLSLHGPTPIPQTAEAVNSGLYPPAISEALPSVSAPQTEVHHVAARPLPKWLIPGMVAVLIGLIAASAAAILISSQRGKWLAQQASNAEKQEATRASEEPENRAVAAEAQEEEENASPVPAVGATEINEEATASAPPLISAQMAGRFSGDIGLVDMNKVFTSYYKTREAEARLNEARAEAKTDLDGRLARLKSEMEEINRLEAQSKNRSISASARQDAISLRDMKINNVRNLDREIGDFRQTREKELQDQFMRMRGDIVQDIMRVVDGVAPRTARRPTLFFDTSSLGVSQVKLVLDQGPSVAALSDPIVQALNANKSTLNVDNIRLNGDLVIGLIDMNKVFTSYYKTREAEARLNEARAEAKTDLDGRLARLKSEMEEINRLEAQSKNRSISASARQDAISLRDMKINNVRNLDREIGDFRQTREKELQDQFMRMRGDIVQDIMRVVELLTAGESDYLLFDISGLGVSQVPALVYVGEELSRMDDDVIKTLNRQGSTSSAKPRKEARKLKIAVVDMNKVFTSLRETKAAETELDDARERAKLEINRKSKTMSADEVEKLRKRIEDDLQARFTQMRTRIVKRIREALDAICKQEAVDILFDTSSLGVSQVKFVLFAAELPDLTDKAKLRLEK